MIEMKETFSESQRICIWLLKSPLKFIELYLKQEMLVWLRAFSEHQ